MCGEVMDEVECAGAGMALARTGRARWCGRDPGASIDASTPAPGDLRGLIALWRPPDADAGSARVAPPTRRNGVADAEMAVGDLEDMGVLIVCTDCACKGGESINDGEGTLIANWTGPPADGVCEGELEVDDAAAEAIPLSDELLADEGSATVIDAVEGVEWAEGTYGAG